MLKATMHGIRCICAFCFSVPIEMLRYAWRAFVNARGLDCIIGVCKKPAKFLETSRVRNQKHHRQPWSWLTVTHSGIIILWSNKTLGLVKLFPLSLTINKRFKDHGFQYCNSNCPKNTLNYKQIPCVRSTTTAIKMCFLPIPFKHQVIWHLMSIKYIN